MPFNIIRKFYNLIKPSKKKLIEQKDASLLMKRAEVFINDCDKNVNQIIENGPEAIAQTARDLNDAAQLFGGHHEYFRQSENNPGLQLGIQACDIAEKLIQRHSFTQYSKNHPDPASVIENNDIMMTHTAVTMTSRQLQYYKYGCPNLDIPFESHAHNHETFHYFRNFESTRRYFIDNEYQGNLPEFYEMGSEPKKLSLEACIHRAINYEIEAHTFSGACELLGMFKFNFSISYEDPLHEWKSIVRTCLKISGNAIIVPSDTEGTRWEQVQVANHTLPRAAAIVGIPQVYDVNMSNYWSISQAIFQKAGFALPHYNSDGLIAIIGKDGRVNKLPFSALFDNRFRNCLLGRSN